MADVSRTVMPRAIWKDVCVLFMMLVMMFPIISAGNVESSFADNRDKKWSKVWLTSSRDF